MQTTDNEQTTLACEWCKRDPETSWRANQPVSSVRCTNRACPVSHAGWMAIGVWTGTRVSANGVAPDELIEAFRDTSIKAHIGFKHEGPWEECEWIECEDRRKMTQWASAAAASPAAPAEPKPIDMLLFCPNCWEQHVDAEEDETKFRHRMEAFGLVAEPQDHFPSRWTNPPHRSHLCHKCGAVWRPADVPTNGVAKISTLGSRDTWIPCAPAAPQEDTEPQYFNDGHVDLGLGMVEFEEAAPTHSQPARDAAREIAAALERCEIPHHVEEAEEAIAAIISRHLPAGTETVGEPSCWHCGVVLAYAPKLRCEDCPVECDTEGCEELGCADSAST